jgi:hypothetical protein
MTHGGLDALKGIAVGSHTPTTYIARTVMNGTKN